MRPNRTRVVVTGLGAVSGLGVGAKVQIEKALAGISGITPLPDDLVAKLATRFAGQAGNFPRDGLDRNELAMFDLVAQLSWAAASEALTAAGVCESININAERAGVFWGVGMGGPTTIERCYNDLLVGHKDRVRPFSVIGIMTNGSTALLSIKSGFKGPSLTYSSACSSSAHAIGEAYRQIKDGYCDMALAGGAETPLTYAAVKAWEALQTLASTDVNHPERSCKPFSINRSGFVLGEAAAALVLESLDSATKRGAKIFGEVIGYGTTSDAQHVTKPSIEGQVAAMRHALGEANLAPADIAYINAHGTATKVGDVIEIQSIKQAFGDSATQLAISSTKAVHGHTLGAAGALELLITLQAQAIGKAPPTAFLDEPDPDCDLDCLPGLARNIDMKYAMSNSFAFGGSNVSLVIQRWDS
jgi:3-oxoacyl-[acyl-carrier-protein] synthase II